MFPRPAAPIFCSVSRVSEATLETYLVGFWHYSSSFRAMVFPRLAAPIFCSVSRVSEATLETFFGGILGLVRPSGPWCFPIRWHVRPSVPCSWCFGAGRCSRYSSVSSSSSRSSSSPAGPAAELWRSLQGHVFTRIQKGRQSLFW